MPDVKELTVGVLGGTGPLGGGLARRFAAAGLTVVVGSRDAAKDHGSPARSWPTSRAAR